MKNPILESAFAQSDAFARKIKQRPIPTEAEIAAELALREEQDEQHRKQQSLILSQIFPERFKNESEPTPFDGFF